MDQLYQDFFSGRRWWRTQVRCSSLVGLYLYLSFNICHRINSGRKVDKRLICGLDYELALIEQIVTALSCILPSYINPRNSLVFPSMTFNFCRPHIILLLENCIYLLSSTHLKALHRDKQQKIHWTQCGKEINMPYNFRKYFPFQYYISCCRPQRL